MAYKKKCPICGEYTYSAGKIWTCATCGAKIDDIEAKPVGEKDERD